MASSNTSKTAHVMNLLSKNRSSSAEAPTAPKEEGAAPQAETAPAEPARTAPVAPIISSINADAAVSSQIKDALEAELEVSAPAPKPAPVQEEAAPAQQAASVQQPTPAQETVPTPETSPVRQAAPMPQAAPVQEAPAAEVPMDLPTYDEASAEEHSYVNVMQVLVEEKADEYMKMFGICCCDKCRVDVRAFALNHLPPKYVVMSEHERVPRLTVYESRFASDITAQLIQACKQVMITPHHSRPEE